LFINGKESRNHLLNAFVKVHLNASKSARCKLLHNYDEADVSEHRVSGSLVLPYVELYPQHPFVPAAKELLGSTDGCAAHWAEQTWDTNGGERNQSFDFIPDVSANPAVISGVPRVSRARGQSQFERHHPVCSWQHRCEERVGS